MRVAGAAIIGAAGAMLVCAASAPARAEVGAYLLFDMADGTVLAEYEATRPWYPASITKLMTAYVTFEAIREGRLAMTSPVRISPQASQQPPSKMGFAIGTVITVETALRIILTKSANDVSVALAEAVGGTQGGFVDRMNAAAAKLGMSTTSYDNPHGLPNAKQITSARDIAVLMMALAEDYPDRADFFDMGGVQLGKRLLRNHNGLIRRVKGADGMKTGFICASGFNLAATVTRGKTRLGAVVLGGLTVLERDQRTAELLEKGFQSLQNGGVVALDGFDDPDGGLAYAAVTGERPSLGTVEELAPRPEATVANRRDEVCGARRPITRYDDGTVSSLAELEAQRGAANDYRAEAARRARLRAERLAAPRDLPPLPTATAANEVMGEAAAGVVSEAPGDAASGAGSAPDAAAVGESLVLAADTPVRAYAGEALVPEGWARAAALVAPPPRPARDDAEATMMARADFAPDDWRTSPGRPWANPLRIAAFAVPLGDPPPERPLGYLGPSRAIVPIPISIGGADDTRPTPLSGTVVGGGRAPLPRTKPLVEPGAQPATQLATQAAREPIAALFTTTVDPDAVVRHAAEVRAEVGARVETPGGGS
ncbi:D-alanyl-D-alanine carboxypeptidase family protein [Acuticoccus mangrovi]|nr:D-alanyl-D-alanine carboxypeptidase family protein [Acuticoccus mangrovi]